MRMQGKITKWKDDRGFGYIEPDAGGPEIFLHEDELLRRSPRPVPGRAVTFETITTSEGRTRAARVLFLGESDPRKMALRMDILLVTFALVFLAATFGLVYIGSLPLEVWLVYFFASSFSVIVYRFDKSAAESDRWRTRESFLHVLSIIGGWPGSLVAQRIFHHKSRKRSFQIVYWGTVAVNFGLLVFFVLPVGKAFLKTSLSLYSMQNQKIIAAEINKITGVTEKRSASDSIGSAKYKGAVYSWTNKEGKKVFSNVGFPKDQDFTDAKIEWQ